MTDIEDKRHIAELASQVVSQIASALETTQPTSKGHGEAKKPKDGPDESKSADKRYAEICNNIRALDQNSFQLLRFVPLVTTAAILGLAFLDIPFLVLWLISWVGAAVTFGLYRWEMRNVQICKWLQERAVEIERTGFNVSGKTQFAFRLIELPARPSFDNPKLNDLDTQKIFGWTVKFKRGEPFRFTQRVAERIIYGATILAWLAMPVAVWLSPKS